MLSSEQKVEGSDDHQELHGFLGLGDWSSGENVEGKQDVFSYHRFPSDVRRQVHHQRGGEYVGGVGRG